MRLTAQRPITDSYAVEVSGWDSNRCFFVEKCALDWTEETGKRVTLTPSLCAGAMIFVRLLQPMSSNRSLPVAYRAQPLGATLEGRQQFRLSPVLPSLGSQDKS